VASSIILKWTLARPRVEGLDCLHLKPLLEMFAVSHRAGAVLPTV
jgi:hypothetical protein